MSKRPKALDEPAEPHPFSIGDVAQATGLSEGTIRIWERRYGRPAPAKTDTGHRRYSEADVRWMRRVAEALALGHRPSQVVDADDAALDALLSAGPRTDHGTAKHARVPSSAELEHMVAEFRGLALGRKLRRAYRDLGPINFADQWLAPFLSKLGRDWADGKVSIGHEHFVSNVVEDVLRSLRAAMRRRGRGPIILFAALPGEQHQLGVQMAALVAAHCDVAPRVLGADTPLAEIARVARLVKARAIGLSVSLASAGSATDRTIRELRASIPECVAIVVGGQGARGRGLRRGPRGIVFCRDLAQFAVWLAQLRSQSRQS